MKDKKLPVLVADVVIIKDEKVLLMLRAHEPFRGYWVLPGGHVDYGETTEHAAIREVKEEVGLDVELEELVGVYSSPNRDPRYHAVSVTYIGVIKGSDKIKLGREGSEYKYFSPDELPQKMGFDHRKIIKDALRQI